LKSLSGRELALSLAAQRKNHAIIIEGERGCGKRTLARKMAAVMFCPHTDPVTHACCGSCTACAKVMAGTHPDITVIDNGAKMITVDEIRKIRSEAGIRPNEADARLFIICDGQNMNVQAQNALLKILEEPPGYVRFIITCDNMSRMLETIISRAVPVKIGGFSQEECLDILKARFADKDDATLINLSRMFEGNVGRCIEALDPQNDRHSAELMETAEAVYAAAGSTTGWELLSLLSRFEKDKEGFAGMLELLRLKCRCTGENAAVDKRHIAMAETIDRARRDMERNLYFPLVISAFAAKLRSC